MAIRFCAIFQGKALSQAVNVCAGTGWEQKRRIPSVLPSPALPYPGKTVQTKMFNCMKSRSIRQAADGQQGCAELLRRKSFSLEFPGCGIWCDTEVFFLHRAGFQSRSPLTQLFLSLFQQSCFSPCKCSFCFHVP